jgi:hypothetical protein
MYKLSSDYFIERRIRRQTMLVYICLLLALSVTATFYCAATLDTKAAKQSVTPSVKGDEVIYTIAQTQCFYSTDRCLEWAFGMFENSDDLARDMHTLVRSRCFEPTDGCLEWAFDLIEGAGTRSVLTNPLPGEGD